jgi:hypothetical protein
MQSTAGIVKAENKRSQNVGSLKKINISDLKLFEVAKGCSLSGTLATTPHGLVCNPKLLNLARVRLWRLVYACRKCVQNLAFWQKSGVLFHRSRCQHMPLFVCRCFFESGIASSPKGARLSPLWRDSYETGPRHLHRSRSHSSVRGEQTCYPQLVHRASHW